MRRVVGLRAGLVVALVVVLTGCAWVGRDGVGSSGSQSASPVFGTAVSTSGRFVVFSSDGSDLVGGDGNGSVDVFLRDNQNSTTERVSLGTNGEGNAGGYGGLVSSDGRYVAFSSDSTNLISGDTNAATDVFVRDRTAGTTTRVSVTLGTPGDGGSYLQSMSSDGRYVVFESDASNLVGGDSNGATDIFVRDTMSATTTRVSVASNGTEGDQGSFDGSISNDGRYVVFTSDARTLDPTDSGLHLDVFVRDRTAGTTSRLSVFSGREGNGDAFDPHISGDGSVVAFDSDASNLTSPPDTSGNSDVFVDVLSSRVIQRISTSTAGGNSNGDSFNAGLSGDGRFVVFESSATNLVSATLTAPQNSFVRDRTSGATALAGLTQQQGEPTNPTASLGGSQVNGISGDGRYILYTSTATDVVGADANGSLADVLLRSNPIPLIFSASPSSIARGTTGVVALRGTNLHPNSTVLMGDGVTVNAVTYINSGEIDVNVTVAPTAAPGPRMPFVLDSGTGAGPFTGGLAFFPNLITVT